jgi:hypothetical protein
MWDTADSNGVRHSRNASGVEVVEQSGAWAAIPGTIYSVMC